MNAGKVAEPGQEAAVPLENAQGGALPPAASGVKSLSDLGVAWRVLSVEEIGYGSVAWIALSPILPGIGTCGAPSRGQGAARALRFGETGQVPEIEVENLGDGPVLIPAHLVVIGGWQTRAVERSVVIPARSLARVPVKCVEAGRWAPRDEKSAGSFEVSDRTALRTRWSTSMNMLEQLKRHGRFAAEQSAVWQHVEEELSRSPEPSHTRSYEAYLRGVKQQHLDAVRKANVKPPKEANAVVLFPRGGGFWIEAYATPESLTEQADDLLADLFDPSTQLEVEAGDSPTADALLRMLWSLPLRGVDRVTGTVGHSYAISCRFDLHANVPVLIEQGHDGGPSSCETTGALLAVDGGVAHLSVGGAPSRLFAKGKSRAAANDSSESRSSRPALSANEARITSAAAAGVASLAEDAARADKLGSSGQAAVVADKSKDASADPRKARAGAWDLAMPPLHEGVASGSAYPGSQVSSALWSRERAAEMGVASAPPFDDEVAPGDPSRERDRAPMAGAGPSISGQERSSVSRASTGSRPSLSRVELPASQERPKIGREAMRAIYARARDLLPFDPPPREDTHGYRLMRVLEGNVSWVDIRIGGDGYAVLGSHDRCDLVLASDAGIWLRHMIAICVRLEDSSVGLRLIDLKTDIPFFLEDDVPQWSVTATGPFAIRLGRHIICGFPIGQGTEESVAEPQAQAVGRAHTFDSLSRSRAAVMETSALDASVQLMRPLKSRDEPFTIVPSAPVSQIQELVGPSASPNHVRVTLERGGMGASVEIPTDALDIGVLLGRALNCFDGGLRRIFCDAVSRAHVLLLRDRDDVHAIDLCTTNGTRVAGRRIRRYRLSNDGATLELGKKVLFRWHRRRMDPPPPGDRGGSGPEQPGEARRDAGEGGSGPSG